MSEQKDITEQLTIRAPRASGGRPPELTLQEDVKAAEVDIVDSVALVKSAGVDASGYALEAAMFKSLERARELGEIQRVQAETLVAMNRHALMATDPGDWVLNKDKQGNVTGFLRGPGCIKVAPYFDIHLYNWRPTVGGIFKPEKVTGEEGEYGYEGWVSVYSGKLDAKLEDVYQFVSNTDQFTGRKPRGYYKSSDYGASPLTADADLKKTLWTALRSRAIRSVLGFQRVTLATLKGAGLDMGQAAEGSGYGTSTERSAQGVTDEGARTKAVELGKEILSRTGGDRDAARSLCKDVTSNPPKFSGFDTVERLTKGWQVDNAWKKLREHEVFGDKAQGAKS